MCETAACGGVFSIGKINLGKYNGNTGDRQS